MAYILLPDRVRVPAMRPDCDDRYRLTWTKQPGGGRPSYVGVEGASDISLPDSGLVQSASVDKMPLFGIEYEEGGNTLFSLRDYQKECVNAVSAAWGRGVKAPLIVLPTGAGKTIISSAIIDGAFGLHGFRSVFMAHRRELLKQTVEKIDLVTRMSAPTIGMVQGSKDELHRDVTVASIQTLGGSRSGQRLQRFIDAGPYDVLIVDEAHHAVSPQYIRFLSAVRQAYPQIRLLGMTATPGRADGTALDGVFDEVVFERNLLDMIRLGYLVPPKGYAVNLGLNLDMVKSSKGDWQTKQLSKLMNQDAVHRAVVEAWCRYGHNRKTLVFAVDVAHATALTQEFVDAGYAAAVVHGKMKVRERDGVFKDFRDGKVQILINCEIATEGFDEPSIEAVLWARPTQSQALYIQGLGRGLRLFPGKTECLVIDCVGNSERHTPVQLATLAGFDPELAIGSSGGRGSGNPDELPDFPDSDIPTVVSHSLTGSEVDLTGRRASLKYQWRETSLGWVLQIPRIGYYLVAWSTKSRTRCNIRFYDQRPGRKQSRPVEVVSEPIDFALAYGLVEAEMDRIFKARQGRSIVRRRDGSTYEDPNAEDREFYEKDDHELPEVNFVDLDDGLSEQIEIDERLLLSDEMWRERSASPKQIDLLKKLGVKKKSMPEKAGEASDLITILRIEKDAKRRMPPTQKQIAYLKVNEIPIPKGVTKGVASQLIWKHRKAAG